MSETLVKPQIADETRIAMYELQLPLAECSKNAPTISSMPNLVKGTSHLGLGQEAVAAGFAGAMRRDDWSFCTSRGHDHTIARGVSMTGCMAELLGRNGNVRCAPAKAVADAPRRGRRSLRWGRTRSSARSCRMRSAQPSWTAQYKKTATVAVCFFGDSTTRTSGAFHEALNLAAVWKKLPVVVQFCENNLRMEYTPIGEVTAVARPAADRATAYGLEPIVVDGNDADACYLVAQTAYERARRGAGPSLIEALTYRHGGHSRADPAHYRPQAEVAAWLERDPLPMYRKRLLAAGITVEVLERIEAAAQSEIDAATEAAENRPPRRATTSWKRTCG